MVGDVHCSPAERRDRPRAFIDGVALQAGVAASGGLLILVGVLMFTGWFERLAAILQPLTPAFLVERL